MKVKRNGGIRLHKLKSRAKKLKTNTLGDVAKIDKHDAEIIEALQNGFVVIDAYIGGEKYRTMVLKPDEKKPI